MTTQKTLTINGIRITPNKLRKSNPCEANGGHNISEINGLEIHWAEWGNDEIHIYNAGSVCKNSHNFGSKVYALEA